MSTNIFSPRSSMHSRYDQDDPEPAFEAPTPLRYNQSFPTLGSAKHKLRRIMLPEYQTVDIGNVSNIGDDRALSPSANPAFYPSLRFHRKNSLSDSAIAPPVTLGESSSVTAINGRAESTLFPLEKKTLGQNAVAMETEQNRRDYATALTQLAGVRATHDADKSGSVSARYRTETSILSSFLRSTGKVSDFDISVIAPQSL